MLNIINLYYKYVFSKKIILIFILINIIYITSLIYSSGILDGYSYIDMYKIDFEYVFYNDFVLIVRILSVVFNVFMVSLIYKDSCVNLSKYLVDKPIKKFYIIWSKLIFLFLISFMLVSVLFEYYSIINLLFTPYRYVSNEILHLYLAVLTQNITYVLITFFFMSIIPSMLTSLLPMLLFWYMEINTSTQALESNTLMFNLYKYIPNISLNDGVYQLSGDWINYLYLNIIIVLIIVFINVNKEIL
jgi:hypothetical protein